MEYQVKAPVVDETTDVGTGQLIRCEFSPGKHTPKNEAEEAALERTVANGGAVRVKKAKE